MAELNMSATMDAIAATALASGLIKRAYQPGEAVQPPCLLVDYPSSIDFDATFGRGSDKATFPFFVCCGKASERTARDVLSAYIAGATGMKDALDGNLGGVVQTARVTDCQINTMTIAGVEYIGARFELEVYS